MNISRIIVGDLQENCYLIEQSNKVLIIDPGAEFEKIEDVIGNKKVVGVLITHHHDDHVGALKSILKKYGLKEGEIKDNSFKFEIIRTPGHSSDSITIYFNKEKIMFTGDFLFKNSIGRIDLPTGSKIEMLKSLDKISYYPNDITIYPGHGEKSILGLEKANFEYYRFII